MKKKPELPDFARDLEIVKSLNKASRVGRTTNRDPEQEVATDAVDDHPSS